MKYRTVLLAATIAATPIASSAEISGGFGLSFGRISSEGSSEELNNTRLDFNLNYDTGSAFGFGLNGSTSRLSEGADDLTVNNLDGEVFYGLANGYRVGAYAGTLSLTGGGWRKRSPLMVCSPECLARDTLWTCHLAKLRSTT